MPHRVSFRRGLLPLAGVLACLALGGTAAGGVALASPPPSLAVAPSQVAAGSAGNTLNFTLVAAGTMSDGTLQVTVPGGWSPPSTTQGDAGYVTASSESSVVSVSGMTIQVTGINLNDGQQLGVTYGSTSDDGPGASAQLTTGTAVFTAEEASTAGGSLTLLAASPQVTVVAGAPHSMSEALSPSTVAPGGAFTVSGAVYDAGGNAVSGAQVKVSVGGGDGTTVTTGSAGAYSLPEQAPANDGLYTVSGQVKGTDGAVQAQQTLTVQGTPSGVAAAVTEVLSPSAVAPGGAFTVSGTVDDAGGNPVSGAQVQVSVGGGDGTTVTTGSGGAYSLPEQAPANDGLDTVTASVAGTDGAVQAQQTLTVQGAPAGAAAAVTEVVSPTTVAPGGAFTVSGAVYAAGGSALSGATVDVVVGSGDAATAVTGGDGGYSLQEEGPLAAGPYTVTATVGGTGGAVQARAALTVQSTAAGVPTGITEVLGPAVAVPGGTLTVSGVVDDGAGNPVVGAQVEIAVGSGGPNTAVTGAGGAYGLTVQAPAAPGHYLVTAVVGGTQLTAAEILSVAPASIELTVSPATVPAGGTVAVSGTVTAAGAPLAGLGVQLLLAEGGSDQSVGSVSPAVSTTDGSGTFRALLTAPVDPGALTVEAAGGGATVQALVLITPAGAGVLGTDTALSAGPCGSAVARVGDSAETGCGSGLFAVSVYAANPTPVSPPGAASAYFDAALSAGNTFTAVSVQQCGVAPGEQMLWWNGGSWQPVSPPAVPGGAPGCLSFSAGAASSPSIAQLTGSIFAIATPVAAPQGGVAGGAAPAAVDPPMVTGLGPTSGPAGGGTAVTITGAGFDGGTAVYFGPLPAVATVLSNGSILAISPPGTGSVDVRVHTPGGSSPLGPADRFTYLPAPASCSAGFADVAASFWAAPAIRGLACAGIVAGFPGGAFRPDAPVTRAEFVTMLVRALRLPPASGGTPFADVPATSWFGPYLAAAAQVGLVDGVALAEFGPGLHLSREGLAVLLVRAFRPIPTGTPRFTDAAGIDGWALADVRRAVAAGYLVGFPDGAFRPLAATTRAEAAQALWAALGRQAGHP